MNVVIASLFLAAFIATPAFAYLDPGTGSMILQAIIGGVAVVGATVSLYWTKVRHWIRNVLGSSKPQ